MQGTFVLSCRIYFLSFMYLSTEKVGMKYKEKLQQANREARGAVIALFLTVIVWIVAGFGVSSLDIVIFNTPLWIITGCFGTWIFAVVAAIYLSKFVFKDVDLDEEDIVTNQSSESDSSFTTSSLTSAANEGSIPIAADATHPSSKGGNQ